jgi:Kdo2-lipid IVA lauroyltransferase/acyltransferase
VFTNLLFRILSRLPLGWLHLLGGWAGALVYRADAGYRRRLHDNLARAIGRDDPALARQAAREAGRQALELPWLWLRPADQVVGAVREVEGWAQVEAAHAAGQGLLFLTPHLGCFEITAQYIATRMPITVLYRPPRKAALEPLMQAGRARGQMQTAPADLSGVRKLVKTLRSREAVGMLPDQAPGVGEGIWVPFFGRPAWTMTLAARMAEVKGVLVVYTWAERLPGGQGYRLRFSTGQEALEGELEARCATINREIERLILACPAQYLWGYDRYKRPRGVPAPDTAA